jgi:hypothetical protein
VLQYIMTHSTLPRQKASWCLSCSSKLVVVDI